MQEFRRYPDNAPYAPVNVRIVRQGDRYGLDDCKTHDAPEPLIEFYDDRYPHTPRGQFISRYFASTILAFDDGKALDLDGGIQSWTVRADVMAHVKRDLAHDLAPATPPAWVAAHFASNGITEKDIMPHLFPEA